MKTFSELFKKYRLRAEFETITAFNNALSEKGYHYEDSIFSHWQKGTRRPTDRRLVLVIIEIFVQKHAIKTREEANEFLSSAGFGYLTEEEEKNFTIKIQKSLQSPKRIKILGVIAIALLFLSSVFIYYVIQSQQGKYINFSQTVPSAVTEPKKLVIGIDATLPPMEYIENDKIVGFDVDLGNQLAKELPADIEFRNITFDNLFNVLDQRQINMIISAVTITEERKQKYDFSEPYVNAGQVIIARKTDNTIKGVSDLKDKKISTQTGTTNELEARKHTKDTFILRYQNFEQATQALVDGKVDALFTDLPNAKGIVARHPELKIVNEPFTKEYYGIVFLKNDPAITQINEALKILRQKGILEQLEKKWLK